LGLRLRIDRFLFLFWENFESLREQRKKLVNMHYLIIIEKKKDALFN
jgi:hypothetical protein